MSSQESERDKVVREQKSGEKEGKPIWVELAEKKEREAKAKKVKK